MCVPVQHNVDALMLIFAIIKSTWLNILNISAAVVSINMASEMDLLVHPFAVSTTELKPRPNDRTYHYNISHCWASIGKVRPNDRNIWTQHIPILLGATCCVLLATLLQRAATCWVLKIILVRMLWCNTVAPTIQHSQVSVALKIWPFSILSQQHPTPRNMSQHVATGSPNEHNMLRTTMLRYVALKCCDRLARA